MSFYSPELRLEYLMMSAIEETDGGEQEATIRYFFELLDNGPDPGDEDDELMLYALGQTEAERYQAALKLFQERWTYGSRPKRPLAKGATATVLDFPKRPR